MITKELKEQGFTLVELMVTLAVLAILVAVALPDFSDTMDRNDVANQSNRITGLLSLARNEAITRNTDVTLCPANATLDNCLGANNYSNGILIMEVGGPVIQVYDSIPDNVNLAGAQVTFTRDGLITSGSVNFTVSTSATNTNTITVSPIGQIE
ncbi:GspH/FimT family pseudopilin [Parendozoicomonas haliclonae]|uniref:Type II secretion system protein H n=1 Tax=Parendozoicomonas haliclonae TaxID=1960125 RepID=A0A1X7AQH0_9GAMM|nr:GspH/FimT family pseudopilin [Parendozoicomonas haliclonae]SMA50382.1 hypothetical protein EHSB41UT_04179 [Parendozoicomonas haliclonae]